VLGLAKAHASGLGREVVVVVVVVVAVLLYIDSQVHQVIIGVVTQINIGACDILPHIGTYSVFRLVFVVQHLPGTKRLRASVPVVASGSDDHHSCHSLLL